MYRIHLDDFEGPLDLLLFFIRRNEFDIFDLPISQITDEYLGYVKVMEEIDLDAAADFIYMAAVLIGIKAKLLLPRPERDDEGEEIDPRRELVERLLEYVRYKEAATHLADRFEQRADRFTRTAPPETYLPEEETEPSYTVSVFDLIAVLQKVLAQAPPDPIHTVRRFEYTVEEQQEYLLAALPMGLGARSFVELVAGRDRAFVIASFLAVLELIRAGVVLVMDNRIGTDFYLQRMGTTNGAA